MLASLRHFLRFIDLDETFDSHGFNKKVDSQSFVVVVADADSLMIERRSLQDEPKAGRMYVSDHPRRLQYRDPKC